MLDLMQIEYKLQAIEEAVLSGEYTKEELLAALKELYTEIFGN